MDYSQEVKARVCSEFEIEKIIGISDDGKYQVQWAPAWVSKNRLVGCDHLIREFLQQESEKTFNVERETQPDELCTEINDDTVDHDPSAYQQPELLPCNKIKQEPLFEEPSFSSFAEQAEALDNISYDPILDVASTSEMNHTVTVEMGNPETGTETSEFQYYTNDSMTSHHSNLNELQNSLLFDDLPPGKNNMLKHTSKTPHNKINNNYAPNLMEKPHRCQRCNKAFSSRGNLNRHIQTHTGVKAFRCLYCDSRFGRNDDLQRHMRMFCKKHPTDRTKSELHQV